MISKISYTEEGGLYTQLDGEPTDIGYNNTERLIVLKLNEVIDELNELAVCKVDKKPAPWPPESAKKEEKLYLTAEGMRAYDGSKWI